MKAPSNHLEVSVTVRGRDFFYLIDLTDLPQGEDEYDWAIDQAIANHNRLGLPRATAEKALAYEPFTFKAYRLGAS